MEPTLVGDLLKRVIIAVVMLTHVQFAAFLIGIFGLAAAAEFFGMLSVSPKKFDNFARSLAHTAVVIYSTGAVIAIFFILIVALLYPTFWYVLMRINFWPLFLEGITFVLTIAFLFPWYYTWDRLAGFKAAHVSLGLALLVVAQLQQAMIDVMAGYMLTPTPPEDLMRVFMNATAIPLDMHRLAGNFSFAGFVVAGWAAIKTLRARDDERRAYYDWVGSFMLIIGIGFLFIMPAIGLSFVEEIRVNSPGAFDVMMRGRLSWYFIGISIFLTLLFGLSVLYMLLQVRKSGSRGRGLLSAMLVVVILSGLLLAQPYVIGPSQDYPWINWVNPIGSMQPWKYIALAAMTLASLVALFSYLGLQRRRVRWGVMDMEGRRAQYALAVVAILASATMALMGYIRESSRSPYLIYNKMRIEQQDSFPRIEPTPNPSGPSSYVVPDSTLSLLVADAERFER